MNIQQFLRLRKAERPSLGQRLGFTDRKVEGPQATPLNRMRRPVVQESDDLQRILALPTREADVSRQHPGVLAGGLDWLKKRNPTCRCEELGQSCARELLPVQGWALWEAWENDGAVLSIGVGHGKELIFELLPMVMRDVKTAVLLIPPDMRESFSLDWERYGQHWEQPNLVGGTGDFKKYKPDGTLRPRLKVIAYSELQRENFATCLEEWEPDLIMLNEAHHVCRLSSTRGGRFFRYAADSDCRVVPGSGTLIVRSIKDSGPLAALALGDGSPFPLDEEALGEWAAAIDPFQPRGKLPALMGALKALCLPGEDARTAFKRRRRLTPGVIDTAEASVPNALNFHLRTPPPVPPAVQAAMRQVRETGARPDGEEFTQESMVAKCLRELSAGFYYRWTYPRGEPEELIKRWFSARQDWNREVRELLQYPRPHLDSPLLAAKAAFRYLAGRQGTAEKPVWPSRSFKAWHDVHKLVKPVPREVWVDDWLARDAAAWAQKCTGIVWYSSVAFGKRVAELSGLKLYDGGDKNSRELLRESGRASVVCSIKAHGTGKNLQMFWRSLVAELPHDAAKWEQLIGRTHRHGQRHDPVEVHLYQHTPEVVRGFHRAVQLAEFVEATTPNRQKLCFCAYDWKVPRNAGAHGASKDQED